MTKTPKISVKDKWQTAKKIAIYNRITIPNEFFMSLRKK